jgi:hypothetical protein
VLSFFSQCFLIKIFWKLSTKIEVSDAQEDETAESEKANTIS